MQETKSFLCAINTTNGAKVEPDADGYVTLANGVRYVFMVACGDAPFIGVSIETDNAILANPIQMEACLSPRDDGQPGVLPGSVTDWDVTAGNSWVKDDSAVNAHVMTGGTGWTATVLTLVKTAGLGCAIYNLACRAAPRYRLSVTVGATGGKVRVRRHGKH